MPRRPSSLPAHARNRLPPDAIELPQRSVSGLSYHVTRSGAVFSVRSGSRPRVRRLRATRKGAPPHYLWVDAPTSRTVHSLVALAYLGPRPTPIHQIMHCDGDVANNDVTNLRYALPLDHVRHDVAVRPRRLPRPLTEAECATILQLRARGKSLSLIARTLNRSYNAVQRLCSRRNHHPRPGDPRRPSHLHPE
jgi:hypothetical protein